ncbi:GNAT family N-acetyltransferase [Rhodococcus sp. 1163]|uniref:GNAT family N-acetyltransferase n=1 Tax=unclassified Rhodococcus (in: high G+C Gram-positive bacteria) TaxID=192944 RepID=UPI000A0380C0|nr:GNAT family N-acetyltransferase [Rhodococcus sp. 1163]ORI16847.1 GNAT family N-acetyltransferase [Rhodococcus sp. 1163]
MRTVATDAETTPYLVDLSPQEIRRRLPEALAIYVAAMGYPQGTEYHRAPMWIEHLSRPGWRGVGAVLPTPDAPLVAVAYGYHGARNHWWHQQVRDGLRRSGHTGEYIDGVLDDYFELTELHVTPSAQGHGLGGALTRRLLQNRPEKSVLLSTPEVEQEDNRAWKLYRRLGFEDVLRDFTFSGDRRPFAVLGHALPFE